MPSIRAAETCLRRAPLPARRRVSSRVGLAGLVAAWAVGGGGCGGDAKRAVRPEYDLHAPSATLRCQATTAVAENPDFARVPELIELLDDDDPAVRLTAGATLKSMTGHDTGYRASAPPAERQRQQALWRAWWAQRTRAAPSPASAIARPPGYTGGDSHVRRP